MDIDLAALPDDVETLQRLVRSLAVERTSLREAQAEIERLHLIIKQLQRSQFGRRAEQLRNDQLQLGLEDLNVDLARVEARLPPAKGETPRAQGEQACRRTCRAKRCGLMSITRPAPVAAARCT
jgi:transposase